MTESNKPAKLQTKEPKRKTKEQEYLEGWKRARAEMENMKKRLETERVAMRDMTKEAVAMPLLALADNFRALVQHVPQELEDNAWTQGVLHIARQFESMLADIGMETIDEAGGAFDPAIHEAIEQVQPEDDAVETDTVVEVVQPGYRIGERVVRPAKVRVSL